MSERLFITVHSRQPFASLVAMLELAAPGDRTVWITSCEMQAETTLQAIRRILENRQIAFEEHHIQEIRVLDHFIQLIQTVARQNSTKRLLYVANGGPKLTAAAAQHALAGLEGAFVYTDPRYPVVHIYDRNFTRWSVRPVIHAQFSLDDIAEVYGAVVRPIADKAGAATSVPSNSRRPRLRSATGTVAGSSETDAEAVAFWCQRLELAVLTLRKAVLRSKIDLAKAAAENRRSVLAPFGNALDDQHKSYVLDRVTECTRRLLRSHGIKRPRGLRHWLRKNARDLLDDIVKVMSAPRQRQRTADSSDKARRLSPHRGPGLEWTVEKTLARTLRKIEAEWVVLGLFRRVIFEPVHSWNPAAGPAEADVVLLLRSGRVLVIECKGSNIDWPRVLRQLYQLRLAVGRLTSMAVCVPGHRRRRGSVERSPIEGVPILTLDPTATCITHLEDWLRVHGVASQTDLRQLFKGYGANWIQS